MCRCGMGRAKAARVTATGKNCELATGGDVHLSVYREGKQPAERRRVPTGWVYMQGDERVGATKRLDGRAAGPQLAT